MLDAGARNCRFTLSCGQGVDVALCVVFMTFPRTAPHDPITLVTGDAIAHPAVLFRMTHPEPKGLRDTANLGAIAAIAAPCVS